MVAKEKAADVTEAIAEECVLHANMTGADIFLRPYQRRDTSSKKKSSSRNRPLHPHNDDTRISSTGVWANDMVDIVVKNGKPWPPCLSKIFEK